MTANDDGTAASGVRVGSPEAGAGSETFTASAALRIVRAVCAHAGVPADDAACVQPPADNATITLPSLGLVARIGIDSSHVQGMRKELEVSAWLSDHGIAAVLPVVHPPCRQLMVIDGRVLTWWKYLPGSERASAKQLATILRQIHDQPDPPSTLPPLDPFARVEHQIAAATGLTEEDRTALRACWNLLARRWNSSHWPQHRPVLVHGDAHPYNTLKVNGRVHVLDFEDAALGPWQWDLTGPCMYHLVGWMTTSELHDTLDAYGRDPRETADFDLLVSIRMLRATCWYASRSGREPHVLDQVRSRIASLTDPSLYTGWSPGW